MMSEATSSSQSYDFTLVMIGDAGVGKTSLLVRFADDQFAGSYMPTVGVDFRYRKFTLNGKNVRLQIWDTAGQERFRTMTASYYRGADGVILVYDITNANSFKHVVDWMKSVDKYARQGVVRMVVGNKSDMDTKRQVSKDVAMRYAEDMNIMWIETSAKSAENVTLCYRRMATKLMTLHKDKKRTKESKTEKLDLNKPGRRRKCC
mmetsp:Transcript_9661/g.23781  ORF Transcript_9661/g.23781 Transcript_9661/m.23781 type:complete len:205 (-) Transcript_9661:292-906(-)